MATKLAGAAARLEELVAAVTDRQDADRDVGDAGRLERREARADHLLVAGRQDVGHPGRVALVEQALVVGRHGRLAEHAVGAGLGRVDLVGRHKHTGTPATMRGAGRPASAAAV